MQEFRYGKTMKIFLMIICIGLIGGFSFGLFQFDSEHPTKYFAIILPTCLVMIALGTYGAIDLMVGSLIISTDRVTLRTPLGYRTLTFDEIRGFRVDDNYIRIIPANPKQKKLKVTKYFKDSGGITDWLYARYVNLDEVEGTEDEHEVLQNETLGITRERREEKLNEARKVARIVNGGAWLVFIWLLLFKQYREYALAVGCVYPLIAIFVTLRYRGIMTADDYDDSKLPSCGIAMIVPGVMLALRALFDFTIAEYPPFIWVVMAAISIVTALMYTLPSFKSSTKPWRFYGAAALMVFLNFFYSFGVVVVMNCKLDRSTPIDYTTTVVSKYKSNGRVTTYHLKLNPVPGHNEVDEAKVTRAEFESIEEGGSVVVREHAGYLRMKWVEVVL